jgi:hypothetical protein
MRKNVIVHGEKQRMKVLRNPSALTVCLLGLLLGIVISNPVMAAPEDEDESPQKAPRQLQVSGVVRWADELQLWVYCVGGEARHAIAWGQPQLETAVTDQGEQLQLQPSAPTGFRTKSVLSGFRPHRDDPRFGIRASLPLSDPTEKVKELAHVKGTIRLRVPRDRSEFYINGVRRLSGQPITHSELRRAGIGMWVKWENPTVPQQSRGRQQRPGPVRSPSPGPARSVLEVHVSPLPAPGAIQIEPVDAEGRPANRGSSFTGGEGRSDGRVTRSKGRYRFQFGERIPADLRLRVALNMDLHEIEVPL